MRVSSVEAITVSVPYRRREVSAVVARDGVTDVLVKITTDDGIVGWGEACSGADAASVEASVRAMAPFVVGGDPWARDAMRADAFHRGLWKYRPMTGNYAWAGIDMALWDLCGHAAGQPVYSLLGGRRQDKINYFYYLAQGSPEDVAEQCAEGLAAGFDVFYMKVGIDISAELRMLATAREHLGAEPRLRVDANGAWTIPEALRNLDAMALYDIDFVEQPVSEHPLRNMAELRERSPIPVAANEGLWTEADARDSIEAHVADVYTFSSYWTGSLSSFRRIGLLADAHGMLVCKHTHGELGIAAAAGQQVMLTLPNGAGGNQQTAFHMDSDVLASPLPIASGAWWGADASPGLGIVVDVDAIADAAGRYERDGQFLPYQQ